MLIKTFTPKLIEPEPLTAYPTVGSKVRGEVRAIMYDLNMRPVLDTGWTPNLITDAGMSNLSYGSIGAYMNIGSSSTPPSFSDTSLGTWVARVSTGARYNTVNGVAPLYQFGQQRRGRFDPGVATGWVREMGFSKLNVDNPNSLDIRALLNPAIDKGVDNYLDVWHRMWTYPTLTRSVSNLVLAFNGKTYECTAGLCDVGAIYYAESPYNSHIATSESIGPRGADGVAEAIMPTITESPNIWTNTVSGSNTWPHGLGYLQKGGSSPQWWADSEMYLNLDNANFTHGFVGHSSGWGPSPASTIFKYVDVLDRTKGIPKDETMRFRVRFRNTVERYTP